MSKIIKVQARQVFDSRGNPTVEAEVILENNIKASAIVPSGASTGTFEAHELRDKDEHFFKGKSVLKAVRNINRQIHEKLKNLSVDDQGKIDQILVDLDGTENKIKLGANSTLAVSIAVNKAASINKNENYSDLKSTITLPLPLMNIINGGAHADNGLKIQEFMIRPENPINFMNAIEKCFLVIHSLKKLLKSKKLSINVGDEGGFAPSINSNEEALDLILEAISLAKLRPAHDISICLDVAANELVKKKR